MPTLEELREAHNAALSLAEGIEQQARDIVYRLMRGQYDSTLGPEQEMNGMATKLADELGFLRQTR